MFNSNDIKLSKGIIIPQTLAAPHIVFKPEKGHLLIQGKSLLEDPYAFYTPIIQALREHVSSPNTPLFVEINFVYLNSSSSRCFMEILTILENSDAPNKLVWYFENGDDIMEEKGEQFQSMVEMNFEIKELQLNSK